MEWTAVSTLKGQPGIQGPPGIGINMKGTVPTSASLPTTGNTPNDTYTALDTGHAWTWNGTTWIDIGQIQGPQGNPGNPGAQGNPGAPGQGYNWRGVWSASTAYNPYDTVQRTNSTYNCVAATTGTDPATDTTHWNLMALAGSQGVAGPPGPTALSADANNVAKFGSDHLLWVPGMSLATAAAIGAVNKLTGNTTDFLDGTNTFHAVPTATPTNAGLLAAPSGRATDYIGGDNASHPLSGQPLASTSAPGLLATVSGNATDYIGGDNAPHPTQASADYGDLIAPSSPTAYDDEFNVTPVNSKWTVAGLVANYVTCQIQLPTYLQMVIAYGAGSTALGVSAKQSIGSLSTSWLFQFKLRWNLLPYQTGTTSTSTVLEWSIGLSKTTTTTKGFWVFGVAQCSQGAAGTQVILWPMQFGVYRGVNAGTTLNTTMILCTGLDLRVQMGVQGANLVCNVSMDGYNWVNIYTEAYSSTTFAGLVPNLITLGLDNGGGGSNSQYNGGFVSWDYVRCLHT